MEDCELRASWWREYKPTIVAWGGFIAALIVMRALVVVLSPIVSGVYLFMNSGWMARVNIVVGIATVGGVLFLFRKYLRLTYGLSEVAFGVVSAWSITGHSTEPNQRLDLIALMGVLYLIVRGIDNCQAGSQERKKAQACAEKTLV